MLTVGAGHVAASGVQTSRTQTLEQEMNCLDCEEVDDEEIELLSVTLAASRLVEESQVRVRNLKVY